MEKGGIETATAPILLVYVKHLLWIVLLAAQTAAWAGEGPLFVTYTHQMEEPGNLEVAVRSVTNGDFLGNLLELEYGAKGWWTTELYLDGQATRGQGALFTGYRWENRFRVLRGEHWINPVLYFEFENINGADKSLLEVVSTDGDEELREPNHETRLEKKRELEAKLILGSYVKGWTIAENFIAEKNLRHAPFEFGYSVGVSRPVALVARPDRCQLCPENLQVGVEVYGGLGTHQEFGLRDTSHYLAPTVSWALDSGVNLKLSPGFGLTDSSAPWLLRFGVSYEVQQLGRWLKGGR